VTDDKPQLEHATPSSDDDAARLRDIQRYRLMATGLLGFVAVILVLVRVYAPPGFYTSLALAGLEAALVGGLADWFAVTALFRRPLGLPIPHTAIVPRAKERIAEGLGIFVTRNFLEPSLLHARLGQLDMAGSIASWLNRPIVAQALGERMAASVPVILNSLEDKQLRQFVGQALAINASRAQLSPIAARTLRGLVDAGEHGPIIQALARMGQDLLAQSDSAIKAEITANSSWWVPRIVDNKLAEAVSNGLANLLEELERPTSASRQRLDQELEAVIWRLENEPTTQASFEAWKNRLLAQPGTQVTLAKSWDAIKAMLSPVGPQSFDRNMADVMTTAVRGLGSALARDLVMRDRLNRRLRVLAMGGLVPLRGAIGTFITDVVQAWDAKTLTHRIELSVAKDLQYIRVSGTLVGALVGCVLFLIQAWFVRHS
jgi:uncharacterized membrane-anchored protein YjiN (DUF445 family)